MIIIAFSAWKYKKYEDEVMNDELIKDALELLEKRYKKMADWLKENDPLDICPNCDSSEVRYEHDKVVCEQCGHEVLKEVPYPAQGGTVASRKIESVIKEIFSSRMREQRLSEEPPAEALASMPFSIGEFDTGEYTPEQVKYLKQRFNTLIEENNIANEVDKFYVRSLVVRELKLMMLERQDAVKGDVSSSDLKRQYKVYDDLATKLKANKSSRSNNEEESFFSDMEDMLDGTKIEDLVKEYAGNPELEEYKKKAEERRREVGNPY